MGLNGCCRLWLILIVKKIFLINFDFVDLGDKFKIFCVIIVMIEFVVESIVCECMVFDFDWFFFLIL